MVCVRTVVVFRSDVSRLLNLHLISTCCIQNSTYASQVSAIVSIYFWVSQAPDETGSAAAAVGEATEMTWTPVSVLQKSVAGNVAQETYSPRFVAYLARFLLNYDGWVGSLAPLMVCFVLFTFHTPLQKQSCLGNV